MRPNTRSNQRPLPRALWALTLGAAVAAALWAMPGSAHGQNVVSNPGFETVGPSGPSTVYSGPGYNGGSSAANDWTVWNNSRLASGDYATTSTELLASTDTLAPGGSFMLHITVDSHDNGIFQDRTFSTVSPAYASVDVYVLSGQMYLGLVGANPVTTLSTTTNTWERLYTSQPSSSEIFMYSAGGPADFYLDNAFVGQTPLPEPSAGVLLIGAAILGGRRLRPRNPPPLPKK
jgi:hypothetical protein